MSNPKTKLELTRPGKYKDYKLEPRVLIEKHDLSYGNLKSENILIHGDNLLALKALEQEFSGQVKCVYIDPPYNTGNAFEHYDDGLEHSEWLSLMKPRLELLRNLMSKDGVIFVQIDDEEMHYLKVILDEIFGRNNFLSQIVVKRSAPTGHKAINPAPVLVCDYILMYVKDKSQFTYNALYTEREYDKAYSKYILNYEKGYENWSFVSLKEGLIIEGLSLEKALMKCPEKIIRFAQPSYDAVGNETKKLIDESKKNPSKIYLQVRDNNPDIYLYGGNRILFYKDKLKLIDGQMVTGEILTNLRLDTPFQGIAGEGGVIFTKSKKPEKLIKRCLEIGSKPGDLVLDSFFGSGTTGAVAHKMGRKWIGIELGDHAYTHCKVRIDKVVDGEQGGISKVVNRQGGGGYKFYELGPSVMVQDAYGNYIINPEFNSSELIQSICKIENFTYKAYLDNIKHGYSTEKDFIHVTTRHITQDIINDIVQNSIKEGETMLLVAKTFASDLSLPDSIQMKKIPPEILGKCEYGKSNYSLPVTEQENDEVEEENE